MQNVMQGEMAAEYILEHNPHKASDPDGFKHSLKDILKSHLQNPFDVSNIFDTLKFAGRQNDASFHDFNLGKHISIEIISNY